MPKMSATLSCRRLHAVLVVQLALVAAAVQVLAAAAVRGRRGGGAVLAPAAGDASSGRGVPSAALVVSRTRHVRDRKG